MASTHYLIDAHTIPVSSSDIQEARYNVTSSPVAGTFVIRVPDDKPLQSEPDTLGTLLTQKYQAILAYYATFSTITYEDFTETPGVNTALSPGTHSGDRCTCKVNPSGVLRTNAQVIVGTPSLCVVTWEAFRQVTTNPKTGRVTRAYEELAADDNFTVEISFNNGATWTAANDGGLLSIAAPDQGSNMILRFTNSSSPGIPVWLGSWAVLF